MSIDRAVNRAMAIVGRAGGGRLSPWTMTDETWNSLDAYQKAAAMALMEADGRNFNDARNAAGAMVNRAAKSGADLGSHVSGAIYQPTIEQSQQQRLPSILKSPEFGQLTQWVKARSAGDEPDPVAGATHFLAKPQVMLSLESRQPDKYKNWGPRGENWTGYDPKTGQYANQTIEDGSHAFLAPEGKFSAPYSGDASVGDAWASNTPNVPVSPPAVKIGAVSSPPADVPDVPVISDGGSGGFGSQFLAGLGKMATSAGAGQAKTAQAAPQPMQLHPYAPNPQQIAAALQMAQAGTPYARGGSVARAMRHVQRPLDTGKNIPESPQTLQLQQQQLVGGLRPAQMFPLGTPELPLPEGMRRLETPRGVFHYNPFVISAADVQKAAATGRENEILGLGPHSKADVETVARQTGESPMVLMERSPSGAEVKGSLTVPSLARDQGAAVVASKTPGNTVSVEPLGQVLSDRTNHASGGSVSSPIDRALRVAHGYASGGGVGLEDTVDALYRATLGMTPPEREKYIHDWWAMRTLTNDRPRAETAPVPVKRGDSRPSAPNVPALRDAAPSQPSLVASEPYRGDPPTPGAELKSYTPPRWSDRVANGFGDVLDAVGIDSAGSLAKHYTNSARMTAGLLPPVGLHDGAVEMKQGYDRGDTNQMIRGGVEAGLSLPGFMGAKSGVQSMMARRAASLEDAAAARQLAAQEAADAAYRADPLSEIKRGIEQRRALLAQRVIDEAAAKAEASRLNVPLRQNELTNDVVGRDVSSIKDGLSGETLSSKAAAGELGPNDFARDVSSIRPSRGQDLPIEDLPTTTQTPPPTSLDRELFVQDQRPIGQIGAEDFGSTMVDPPRQMRGLAGSDDGLTGGASDVPGGFTKGVSDVENTMPDNIGNIKKPSRARITDEQKADRATYTPAHRKAVKEVLGDLANRTPEEIQALPGLEPKPTADAFGRLFKSRGLPEVPPRELLRRTEGTDKEFGKLQEVGADFKRPATLKRLQGGPNKLAVPLTAGIAGAASGDDGEPSTDISPASDRESAIDRALRASGQYASGGGVRPGNVAKPINKAITLAQGHNPMTGPIHGVTPGRADHIATSVPAGSHILPADLVSGLGQGNTNAGMHVLHKMFKASKLPRKFASGGSAEPIDVLLSDGEYAIHPDIVAEIGGGNMQHGHDILDHWILSERARNIEELKNLPPPAKD
jgi:hypothetical protein